MDTSSAIIPYSPYQQEPLSADVYAFTVVCLMFLGALIQNLTEAPHQAQPVEVLLVDEAEEATAISPPSLAPVEKKEPRVQVPGLEDIVLGCLHTHKRLRTKDLVPKIRTVLPEITKGDINSCLYKLLSRKQVRKTCDSVPLWTRVM